MDCPVGNISEPPPLCIPRILNFSNVILADSSFRRKISEICHSFLQRIHRRIKTLPDAIPTWSFQSNRNETRTGYSRFELWFQRERERGSVSVCVYVGSCSIHQQLFARPFDLTYRFGIAFSMIEAMGLKEQASYRLYRITIRWHSMAIQSKSPFHRWHLSAVHSR